MANDACESKDINLPSQPSAGSGPAVVEVQVAPVKLCLDLCRSEGAIDLTAADREKIFEEMGRALAQRYVSGVPVFLVVCPGKKLQLPPAAAEYYTAAMNRIWGFFLALALFSVAWNILALLLSGLGIYVPAIDPGPR